MDDRKRLAAVLDELKERGLAPTHVRVGDLEIEFGSPQAEGGSELEPGPVWQEPTAKDLLPGVKNIRPPRRGEA